MYILAALLKRDSDAVVSWIFGEITCFEEHPCTSPPEVIS